MRTTRYTLALALFLMVKMSALSAKPVTPLRSATDGAQINAVLDLRKAYTIHLPVWNKEVASGNKDVELDGFDLTVYAYYLTDSLLAPQTFSQRPTPATPTTAPWFHANGFILKYFSNWDEHSKKGEENPVYLEENRHKVKYFGSNTELKGQGSRFAHFKIESRIQMSRNDLLTVDGLSFLPTQPGLYRLLMAITRDGEVTDTMRQHVYFECPSSGVTLDVKNKKILHHISYTKLNVPLVTNTFFEKNDSVFAGNATDRAFRNAFITVAAKRMACKPFTPVLLEVYDDAVQENATLGPARIRLLLKHLKDSAAKMANGTACDLEIKERKVIRANDDESEWRKYVKRRSELSQDKFSQENRVVPIDLSEDAQREIFKPLEVTPKDSSDEIEFSISFYPLDFSKVCVREGKIVITNALGVSKTESYAQEEVLKLLNGEEKLQLVSSEWQQFLREGKFTAQLFLTINCWNTLVESKPVSLIESNTVSFVIERRLKVIRDEIFALNPYDLTDLTYALDHERVRALADSLLKAVQDTLLHHPSPQPPDALVLISGHACILGEVVSQFYNLGLSFARALNLRNLLVDATIKQSSSTKQSSSGKQSSSSLHAEKGDELCLAKQKVREFIHKKQTKALLDNCFQESNGKALVQKYYDEYLGSIIMQKVRHFPAQRAAGPGIPDSSQVRSAIEKIRNLLPGNVQTVTITGKSKGGESKKINVHFVAVGFGAAVPFYREFTLDESTQKAFEKLGYRPEDVPTFFYGDDNYPSGRLMNRRVEVNLIW